MLAMTSGNGGIDLSGIALANLSGIGALMLAKLFVSPDARARTLLLELCRIALLIGLVGGLANGLVIAHGRLNTADRKRSARTPVPPASRCS